MNVQSTFTIRAIEARDDAAVALIIRRVMPEFGADGPGFAIHDAEVAAMSEAYACPRCAYFVVELDGVVCGGGGIAPLESVSGVASENAGTCELRKMYFLPALRGRGAGRVLIEHCINAARALGFSRCYLETLTGMDAAQALYAASGFRRIDQALGDTGHHGCNRFYLREL